MVSAYEEETRIRTARGPARHAFEEEITERPVWLYPAFIGGLVVTLSAVILVLLLGPKDLAGNLPVGIESSRQVDLTVGTAVLRLPESYTQYPRARRGGRRDSLALYAAQPNFTPYTEDQKALFFDNAPDTPVVLFQISAFPPPLSEKERLRAVYLDRVADPKGTPGPAGLTAYRFTGDTSFTGEDLFLGRDSEGQMAIVHCERQGELVPSPNCWRDTQLANGLALSYRFKRPYLNQWKNIDQGIRGLVDRFQVTSTVPPPQG